jgi:ketosteroid isomerase-like protein
MQPADILAPDEVKAALVRLMYAHFEQGRIDDIVSSMADDVTWVLPEAPLIPQAGRRTGREQVREFFALLRENQRPEKFEVESVSVTGEEVTARGRYAWRVLSTGKPFASEFTHVYTIRNGKVVAFVETTDEAAAIEAYTP